MSSSISPIRAVPLPELRSVGGPGAGGSPGEFQSLLSNAIGGVEHLRANAAATAERFMAGDGEEVHTVALATQRAELSFETFMQVRNKVVSAYQAIMQMQV